MFKRYFAGGNTLEGFVDLFSSNLQGIEKIFILKGGPGTGKSTLIKKAAKVCEKENIDAEIIHCSSDPDSLDAIIIPTLSVAIVDGTSPHVIEPTAPGAIEEYVNLGKAWDSEILKANKDTILNIKEQIRESFKNAYNCFYEAGKIHEEWQKYYTRNAKFSKANQITANLINSIFKDTYMDKPSFIKYRFSFANTPNGIVDYIDTIINTVSKRYYLKGRVGNGKSTLLSKLFENAQDRGIDMEVYYNGFNKNKIHMLLFPELDVCIFDCTIPKEFDVITSEDEIIDLYKECIKPNTETRYSREIQGVCAQYNIIFNKGIKHLENAKSLHGELETIYVNSLDFSIIDQISNEIIDYIKNKISQINSATSYVKEVIDDIFINEGENLIENEVKEVTIEDEINEEVKVKYHYKKDDNLQKYYEEFYENLKNIENNDSLD